LVGFSTTKVYSGIGADIVMESIPMHDLDPAIAFYRDTLALPFVIYRRQAGVL